MSNARYFDLVGDIVVILDDKADVAFINSFGADLLGMSRTDIIGKNWFDLFITEKERPNFRKMYQKLLRTNDPNLIEYVNDIYLANGNKLTIAWKNNVISDSACKISGIVSSGRDITAQLKSQEEIYEKVAELEKINSLMISRELKMIELKQEIEKLNKK